MKTSLIGLIGAVSFWIGSNAIADVLGGRDDTYIGFQVTIPLDASRAGFMSDRNEYSAVLINQADGIRDGIVITRDTNGFQTLGYMRPSQTYRIGQSRVADYTIPVARLGEGSEILNNYSGGELVVGLVVGIAAIAKLAEKVTDEVTNCVDPEIDSEEIAGC